MTFLFACSSDTISLSARPAQDFPACEDKFALRDSGRVEAALGEFATVIAQILGRLGVDSFILPLQSSIVRVAGV